MKNIRKTLVSHLYLPRTPRSILTHEMKLSRKDGASKNKETKSSASNNNQTQPQSLPPPPPPKPNTTPATSQQSISPGQSLNSRSSSPGSANSINYLQGGSRYVGGPGTTSAPAPPIVVVSPDPSPPETIERTSLTGEPVPSRNSALSRLRSGPKDMIPVKPPRKQRSSRFVITEKVEIEKLPPFMGPSRVSVVARNWRKLTLFRNRDGAFRASTALRQEASSMRGPL
jgi:serine/threonine-protein phosphatase 2A regulatory subunit B'